MDLFPVFSAVLAIAAVFAWLNHRFVRLPTTIGVMVIALGLSLVVVAIDAAGVDVSGPLESLLAQVQFDRAVLDVMLAFLLFAGALHVKLDDLLAAKWTIGALASVGLLASMAITGGLVWLTADALGIALPFLVCLLFGALISPTDPIAVLGILKSAGAPRALETKITGESLFNDGVAVVVFTLLVAVVGAGHGGEALDGGDVLMLLGLEIGGSVVLGLGAGYGAFYMLRTVDNYQVEVLITLALAAGLYSLAAALHSSGPLAVVVAGLFIGNTGRAYAMSERTVEHLDTFWELVDEILNVILFVLIGLEMILVPFPLPHLLLGLAAIPIALLARFASVGGTLTALRRRRALPPGAVTLLTWGGLRGGISVALALSLDRTLPARDVLVTVTYVVVVFSILVQGLTVGPLVRRLRRPEPHAVAPRELA